MQTIQHSIGSQFLSKVQEFEINEVLLPVRTEIADLEFHWKYKQMKKNIKKKMNETETEKIVITEFFFSLLIMLFDICFSLSDFEK